mmetsp:Transcript_94733/g.171051  ORF Transcript_94733/g.171051 Transcript_94733/m.171051 type:complete len:407 (+) Transcript_94733:113-1333(+)
MDEHLDSQWATPPAPPDLDAEDEAEPAYLGGPKRESAILGRRSSKCSQNSVKSSAFSHLQWINSHACEPNGTVVLDPDGKEFTTEEDQDSPLSVVASVFSPMPQTRHTKLAVHPLADLAVHYELMKQLGQGAYGQVREARSRDSGNLFAVKSITHGYLDTPDVYDKELIFAWRMEHPYVANIYDTFHDDGHLHLVMELCTGGSLTHRINSECNMHSEPRGLRGHQVIGYIWEMLSGIAYLHHYRIAHRDVKPDNYMLATPDSNATLRLIDFGLATNISRHNFLTERVGTPDFAAPEVLAGKPYDVKCDIWSIGVVSYLCAVGYQPFNGKTGPEVMTHVLKNPVIFDPMRWDLVKPQVRSIVTEMLVKDPEKRPSATMLAEANNVWLTKAKQQMAAGGDSEPCCAIS